MRDEAFRVRIVEAVELLGKRADGADALFMKLDGILQLIMQQFSVINDAIDRLEDRVGITDDAD